MLAYSFATAPDLDRAALSQLLGGKGAGLVAMTAAGLPVPPGFTFTTEACRRFLADGWTDDFDETLDRLRADLEQRTGKALGGTDAPLLVSVRSGAPVSMPGMMDTVLNVGMNDAAEAALAAATGDPAFAADTHRRFLLSYADVVFGASPPVLEGARSAADVAGVREVLAAAGLEVPTDPAEQVRQAVRAVFASWNGDRAVEYRRIEGIDADLGTAATVQAMVFGNLGDHSGTGVAFSRDPSTGERGLMGDFLVNAQGEDVVAGDHATLDLSELAGRWPAIHDELVGMADTLERHLTDMVDIEFTVEQGLLWLLQARVGKRSPLAVLRVAVDMADDADFPLDRAGAVERCRAHLDDPPTVALADHSELTPVAEGLGACPGVVSGVLCVDTDEALRLGAEGVDLILARRETSPADVAAMAAAKGLFTTLGGKVSHAAVVARSWGTPAVVGASAATVDVDGVTGPEGRVAVGSVVTVDGDRGLLLAGATSAEGAPTAEVLTIKRWAAELDGEGAAAPPTPSADAAAPGSAGAPGDLDPAAARFGVHHALRIKGMATAETVAAMTGRAVDDATAELSAMGDEGLVTFMEARAFWMISADGRAAHPELLAARTAGLDLAAMPYQEFLALNGAFKQLCTDWQLRDGEPNDHSDEAYDAAIAERLAALHRQAVPVVEGHAAVLDWLRFYPDRLTAALGRFRDGEQSALTGVMCDSYHDVWMELHEDLILTQGIDRVAEGST